MYSKLNEYLAMYLVCDEFAKLFCVEKSIEKSRWGIVRNHDFPCYFIFLFIYTCLFYSNTIGI